MVASSNKLKECFADSIYSLNKCLLSGTCFYHDPVLGTQYSVSKDSSEQAKCAGHCVLSRACFCITPIECALK